MAQLGLATPKKVAYFGLKTPVGMAMQIYWEMGGFEGEALAIQMDQWADLKPTTPTGTLPFAVMADGTALSESGAIGRVLAGCQGLLGTGNDYVVSEMLYGMTADMNKKAMAISPTAFDVEGFDAAKKAAYSEGKPGVLEFATKYDKFLIKGDRFTECGLTFGEVDLFTKIHCHVCGSMPELAAGGLKDFYDRMMAVPAIARVIDGSSKFGALSPYLVPLP